MIEHYANKIIVNATAILTTAGLSLMSLMDIINGLLPTVSLLLTTATTAILAFYWIVKVRREQLEVKKLERELRRSAKNDGENVEN